MIDVKIIAKEKSSSTSSGGSYTGITTNESSYGSGTAKEAEHAAKSDYAEKAAEATHAISSDTATEAGHAESSQTLDSDSPVYAELAKEYLSKLTDDQAAGLITFLKGLHTGNFKANESGGSIDAEGNGELETLIVRSIATIKNLTVTGAAHFFKLVIDEIKSAAGAFIITAADGFKADIVTTNTTDNTYTLYWKATDGEKSITNMWEIGDRAICQTFNAATGTTYDVSNKLWWAHVSGKGSGMFTADGTADETNGERYNYITLNWNLKSENTNGVPAVGDEVSQLGHMLVGGQDYEKDTDGKDTLTSPKDEAIRRQSAIYISSYNSIDTGLTAPLEAFYQGIDDFSLESHRKTYKDANGAVFVGKRFEIELNSGSTIRVPADRGAWTAGTTSYYYDRFSHNGSLWLCVTASETGTTDEPSESSAEWLKQVAKGEKGESGSGSGVNLDLTNENDSVIYVDGTGKTIGLPLTTYAYLYDGANAQSTNIEYSTVASNCTASKITVATNGKATLTVTAVSADIAYVDVNCVYKNVTYTKRFNIKRLHGTDKYELITSVNSVSYNPTTGARSADEIAFSIYRTGQTDGTRTLIALADLPTGYDVYYKKSTSSTTVGPLTTNSISVSEMTSGNVIISIKDANGNVLDSETLPIVSDGKDGASGTSVTITKTEVTYCADSQGTTAPATGWSATIPTVTAGQFLWTKTVVTYSDETSTTSYTVAKAGDDGADGITLMLNPETLEFATASNKATGTQECTVTFRQGKSTTDVTGTAVTGIAVTAVSGIAAISSPTISGNKISLDGSNINTKDYAYTGTDGTQQTVNLSEGSGYIDFTCLCGTAKVAGRLKFTVSINAMWADVVANNAEYVRVYNQIAVTNGNLSTLQAKVEHDATLISESVTKIEKNTTNIGKLQVKSDEISLTVDQQSGESRNLIENSGFANAALIKWNETKLNCSVVKNGGYGGENAVYINEPSTSRYVYRGIDFGRIAVESGNDYTVSVMTKTPSLSSFIKTVESGTTVQYSVDGSSSWHPTMTSSDEYMQTSTDGGVTWADAILIRSYGYVEIQKFYGSGTSDFVRAAAMIVTPSEIDTWELKTMVFSTANVTVNGASKTITEVGIMMYVPDCGQLYICRPMLEIGATYHGWTMYDVMLATGIDIKNKKITATADSLKIQANDGTEIAVFGIDALGQPYLNTSNLYVDQLIAKDSLLNMIASVNINGRGEYIQYYSGGTKKKMEFSDGQIIYYNNNDSNSVKWILGESGTISTIDGWTWINLVATDENGTGIQVRRKLDGKTYGVFTAGESSTNRAYDGLTGIASSTSAPSTVTGISGWFTRGNVEATKIDSLLDEQYSRELIYYVDGIVKNYKVIEWNSTEIEN